MNLISEIAGEICKVLLPIEESVCFGNPMSAIAVCTLSSMKLLDEFANSSIMSKINLAGRLLSENKGIEVLVRNVLGNPSIRIIVLCGKDTLGHWPGHSLLCLHQNGIDNNGRINESHSPHPILSLTEVEVGQFQEQVRIINKTGETEISKLKSEILNLG